jgi:hypothetical protein
MANWRTMVERDYLGGWDLVDDNGKPRDYTMEIKSVSSDLLKTQQRPEGKRKVVITFTRGRKKFVANKTNCVTISSLYGDETDGWIGKLITLYQAQTRNPDGGGQIACVRVRSKRPTARGADDIKEREVDRGMRDQQDAAFGRGQEEPGANG